jgi:hypothetical protein
MVDARSVSVALVVLAAACSGKGSFDDSSVVDTDPVTTPELPLVAAMDVRISDIQSTVPIVTFTLGRDVDAVWLEYSFDEGEWLSSPPRDGHVGDHEEVLLGCPEDLEVTFRIVTEEAGVASSWPSMSSIRNGRVDDILPRPDEVFFDAARAHPDRWVLGSLNWKDGGWTSGDYYVFIMDRKGRYVWSRLTPEGHWALYPRVSRFGNHLMLDESTYWSGGFDGSGGMIHRVTLDGTVWESIPVPGLHHSWDERLDGTLIWGAVEGPVSGAETLDYREPGGDIQTLWDSQEWANASGVTSFFESNTVNWDDERDSVIFSFYTNDSVVEVLYPSGEVPRVFGAITGSYDFEPPESRFDWQHGVHWTEQDTILLSTHPSDGTDEQRAREYLVDDDGERLVEVWSYGEGQGKYAPTAGEIYRLDNGNYLLNYGGIAGIREIDADSELVWDVYWDGNKLVGHTTLIDDLYALNEGPPVGL